MISKWRTSKSGRCLQTISTIIGLSVPSLYHYEGLTMWYIGYWCLFSLIIVLIGLYLITYQTTQTEFKVLETLSIVAAYQLIAFSMSEAIFFKRRKMLKFCLSVDYLYISLMDDYKDIIGQNEDFQKREYLIIVIFNSFTCLYDLIVNWFQITMGVSNTIHWIYVGYSKLVMTIIIMQVIFYMQHLRILLHYNNDSIIQKEPDIISFTKETRYFLQKCIGCYTAIDCISHIYTKRIILIVVYVNINVLFELNILWRRFFIDRKYHSCSIVWDTSFINSFNSVVSGNKCVYFKKPITNLLHLYS